MFFMDRKKIDKELVRSNPADPGSKNYQGYKTLTNTQVVYILNTASVSNGETRVVLLSNSGWLPQKYMASTNNNFLDSSWSNISSDRRFNLTLPDITGWYAIYVKFSLPDGTTTETSNAVYYRNTNVSTALQSVGTVVQGEAITPNGFYTNGTSLAFTNGVLNNYWRFYYNVPTYTLILSNLDNTSLMGSYPVFHSHNGTKLYFENIIKRLTGTQGTVPGTYEGGVSFSAGGTFNFPTASGIWFITNVNNNDYVVMKTNNILSGTFNIYWVRINSDEYWYFGTPYNKQ